MAEPARTVDERGCPRVIGSSDDGKRVVTCGHTNPCPYHGAFHGSPLHIVQSDHDNGGEGSE